MCVIPRLVAGSTAVPNRPIFEPPGDHSLAADEDQFVEFSKNLIRPQILRRRPFRTPPIPQNENERGNGWCSRLLYPSVACVTAQTKGSRSGPPKLLCGKSSPWMEIN